MSPYKTKEDELEPGDTIEVCKMEFDGCCSVSEVWHKATFLKFQDGRPIVIYDNGLKEHVQRWR